MKKLLFGTLATVGIFGLASCSSDDAPAPAGNSVTFNLQVPGAMTRGNFGDGSGQGDVANLDILKYSVYEVTESGKKIVLSSEKTGAFTNNRTEQLSLELVNGHRYQVVFYADNAANKFVDFDQATGVMKVDYTDAASNVADQDAFIGVSEEFTVTGGYDADITLKRPFAQLNWGATDTDNALVTPKLAGTNATVTVKANSLCTTLSIIDGTYGGQNTDDVTFGAVNFGNLPTQTFPVEDAGARLVAMNYILTDGGTIDCELNITGDITQKVTVNSAPVKANKRTNIYGALLTSPGNFNITVSDPFEENPTDIYLTDTEVKEPAKDASGTYLITTEGELRWMAEQVNTGSAGSAANIASYALQNDITLQLPWTPIGNGFNNRFSGKFNGNGHTIYNMVVKSNDRTGFFGMSNGQIENLNFDGATVVSNHWAGVVAGYSDNETGTAWIKNCNVKNSSVTLSCEIVNGAWDNGDKGGLIIGFMAPKDQVEGCTVTNCTLQGYRDLGGIIGYAKGSVIKNNNVDGLVIKVDNTHNYKNYTTLEGHDANGVVGEADGATVSDNTSANVTVSEL